MLYPATSGTLTEKDNSGMDEYRTPEIWEWGIVKDFVLGEMQLAFVKLANFHVVILLFFS